MKATAVPQAPGQAGLALFDRVPDDLLSFGHGANIDAKKIAQFLSLTKADVARVASVSETSVRWDDNNPEAVRARLEEIASTINWVAKQFAGDQDKTATWFRVSNPLLGDISPRDMIRLGRHDRLRRFILQAMESQVRVT
jgi:hypothetical protein